MLTLEVRRRPGTGAEMHRITGPSATVGASSGNEIVVRARGVYGRHLRLLERDGAYHLDLFRGIGAVQVNGREFSGGAIAPGDRITIGEATITSWTRRPRRGRRRRRDARGRRRRRLPPARRRGRDRAASGRRRSSTAGCGWRPTGSAARRDSAEDLATELTDFLDRELPPSEWAVGRVLGDRRASGRSPRPSARTRPFRRAWSRTSARASAWRARRASPAS